MVAHFIPAQPFCQTFSNTLSLVELFIVAKNNGFIQAVKPLLDELRNKGVLIREGVYQEALREAGELESEDE